MGLLAHDHVLHEVLKRFGSWLLPGSRDDGVHCRQGFLLGLGEPIHRLRPVVAVGTTLPDKAISLIGGVRGQSGVVTANALGSNIFVLTLVLGVAALVSGDGLHIGASIVNVDLPLLLGATVLVVALFFRRRLHRATGIALLALYVGYLALALLRG